jgi:hypothetical protein
MNTELMSNITFLADPFFTDFWLVSLEKSNDSYCAIIELKPRCFIKGKSTGKKFNIHKRNDVKVELSQS